MNIKKGSMRLALTMCLSIMLVTLSACTQLPEIYATATSNEASLEGTTEIIFSADGMADYIEQVDSTIFELQREVCNEYLRKLAAGFRHGFVHPLDISMLILEVQGGNIVAEYGDIDRLALATHVFWPIIAGVFIENFNIDIHEEFANHVFMQESGAAFVSPLAFDLSFEGVNYYTGYTTFKRAMNDSSPSSLFRLAEHLSADFLLDFVNIANLKAFEGQMAQSVLVGSTSEVLNKLLAEIYLSSRELALMYASLANGGRLFEGTSQAAYVNVFSASTTEKIMEILRCQLDVLHEHWDVLALIQNELFYSDFRYNIAGTLVDNFSLSLNTAGSWYVGLYPVHDPKFVFVVNASQDMEHFNIAVRNQRNILTMPQVAVLAYEIYELVRLGSYFNFPSGSSSDFITRIESIYSLLDGSFTGFLYIGRDTCEFCLIFNTFLREIYSISTGLELQMFDTDYWRENASFNSVIELFGLEGVPTMLNIAGDGTFTVFKPNVLTMQDDKSEFLSFFGK